MKRLSLIYLAFAMPLVVMADTIVLNENFAGAGSDPSANYLIGVNSTTEGWASGTGITLGTASTGKNGDLIGSFTPQTLNYPGHYISFIVNFTSPTLGQGGSGSAGSILFALDNSLGVSLLGSGSTESVAKLSGGGATAGDLGFFGNIPFQSTGKISQKLYAKVSGTPAYNSLSYYSAVSPLDAGGQFNGVAATPGNLANNDSCTLTFTLTYLAAGQMQIHDEIYDNTTHTMDFSLTTGATNTAAGEVWYVPTTTFDTFDVGVYTGTEPSGYTLYISSAEVIVNIPEPSSVVLFLGGVGALAFVRRFRR